MGSAIAASLVMWSTTVGAAAAQGPNQPPEFIFQEAEQPPLDRSTTYVVEGRRTREGCAYTYPELVVPENVDRWQVRDVGIDPKRCVKLVEEGLPTTDEESDANGSVTMSVDGSAGAAAAAAAATPASGYSHAWFENVLGQTLTSDRTYLTWAYNGTCVVDGNAQGNWTWNTVYYSIVSYSGTGNRTCSRYFGDTWSTFRNNLNGSCYHYFYHVRAYGWYNGNFTANRSDYANCGPVWEHFEYRRTT